VALYHTYNITSLLLVDEMNARHVHIQMDGSNIDTNAENFNLGGIGMGGQGAEEQFVVEIEADGSASADIDGSGNGGGKRGTGASAGAVSTEDIIQRSQDSMTNFEIKRQRIFHAMQSVTADYNNDNGNGNNNGNSNGNSNGNDPNANANDVCHGPQYRPKFFRTDLRPKITAYSEASLTTKFAPLLQRIMNQYNVTHMVHLDNGNNLMGRNSSSYAAHAHAHGQSHGQSHAYTQIVPRTQGLEEDDRMGFMEGFLEQLRVLKLQDRHVPHFVYASTGNVYNTSSVNGDEPKDEEWNVTFESESKSSSSSSSPRSKTGTGKLIEEVMARSYNSMHDIYSVGLRFFNIYGPWVGGSTYEGSGGHGDVMDHSNNGHHGDDGDFYSVGSVIHDMAERALTSDAQASANMNVDKDTDVNTEANDVVSLEREHDLVYIDDAVDAIMTAMQFRPQAETITKSDKDETDEVKVTRTKNVVINVGSGTGSSLAGVGKIMDEYLPRSKEDYEIDSILASQKERQEEDGDEEAKSETAFVASTERAEKLLDFKSTMSLKEGVKRTLAWHNDRTVKGSGGNSNNKEKTEAGAKIHSDIQKVGIGSCPLFDRECMNGAVKFPCLSECAIASNASDSDSGSCYSTIYDDIAMVSRAITKDCGEAVMYTVILEEESLASLSRNKRSQSTGTRPKGSQDQDQSLSSFFSGTCNIAFVRDDSPLVLRLKREQGIDGDVSLEKSWVNKIKAGSGSGSGSDSDVTLQLLTLGEWTILPFSFPSSFDVHHGASNVNVNREPYIMGGTHMIPKWSPSTLFALNVKYALYTEPHVVHIQDPAALMEKFKGESHGGDNPFFTTAMMVGGGNFSNKKNSNSDARRPICGSDLEDNQRLCQAKNLESFHQKEVYDSTKFALKGRMAGGEFLDTSWILHNLVSGDARNLRCDIYGEMRKWNVDQDERAASFITSLHDMWSSANYIWKGQGLWWKSSSSSYSREHENEKNDENMYAILSVDERQIVREISFEEAGAVFVSQLDSNVGGEMKKNTSPRERR